MHMPAAETMAALVVGASGATGRLLVRQLLQRGLNVRVVVRSADALPEDLRNHPNLSVNHASVLDLSDSEMTRLVEGCDAVASCLGHNMTFRGLFGHPRRLVTDATRRLCEAIKSNKPDRPVKFVLMNTTGNSNRDIPERVSFGQWLVIWLLRALLPPHLDNERAADFLRTRIGQSDNDIEWVAVRPDRLIDEGEVSEYEVLASPTRSPIFDAGVTSRINVGHFMAALIADVATWDEWKGRMPVIYNKASG